MFASGNNSESITMFDGLLNIVLIISSVIVTVLAIIFIASMIN
jgi:hypothetical protein